MKRQAWRWVRPLTFLCVGCVASAARPIWVSPVTLSDQTLVPSDLASDEVSIDLQEVFDSDAVKVFVNDRLVYSGIATTPNNGTGLTHVARCQAPGERCTVRLLIGGCEWRSPVDLGKGRYLGVGYREGNVRIEQSKTPILYD